MLSLRLVAMACARAGELVVPPLDIELRGGEALLVTGENGAGKSTLLRTLAGLIPPLSGKAEVEGGPTIEGEERREVAAHAHYLGHRNALKPAATLGANLDFWRRFLGSNGMEAGAAAEAVGLAALLNVPLGQLSAGQQRRAALARLLVSHRPIWLLDEPTGALDVGSQAVFADLLDRHLGLGGIAVVATHQPLGCARPVRELRLERALHTRTGAPQADAWV